MNSEAGRRRRRGRLFVVSAPSGAGKTTLCGALAQEDPNVVYAISYTTRPPRSGEVNGKDYFFVTEGRFREMAEAGEFAEWARVHNHHYGTHEGFIRARTGEGKDVLLDVDVQGAKQLQKRFPDGVFIFVLPPSMDVLIGRLNKRRSDSPDEIQRRLKVAREEIRDHNGYAFLIINDKISQAVEDLKTIIQSERKRQTPDDSLWIRKQFLEEFEKTT